MQNNSEIIVTFHDVLCGRGGFSNQHPGNQLFRAMIKENKDIYQGLVNQPIRKKLLVSSIIKAIEYHGGRFLRKSQQRKQWIQISQREAYTKTCHALRDHDHSVGSDSSLSSDEGRSPHPQHSQFCHALDKMKKQQSVVHNMITPVLDPHGDESNKENQAPIDAGDDVPELISVTKEEQENFNLVSFDDDDDEEEDEENLRPLHPDEFIFESVDEFSHLCRNLLVHLNQ